MTDAEFEKVVADLRDHGIEIDRPVKEHSGWTIGDRARVIEDDETEGLFAGDEGTIVPEEVGAVQYNNLQVRLFIVPDGLDCPLAVEDWNLEAA